MDRQSNSTIRLFVLCLALLLPLPGWADTADAAADATADAAAPITPAVTNPTVAKEPNFLLQRIKFLSADGFTRFRYMDKAEKKVTDRDLQYKISTRVQVDLIGDGTTYIQGRGESGRSFTSSFDYSSIGMNKGYWSFNLKSLFVGQKIGNHLEAQAGGIEYDWGAGTEATYADYDGWLEGYRLRYSGEGKGWMPNRIGVTVGYVGDFTRPNVFARFDRMTDENYIQVLAYKKLGTRDVSAEFDSIESVRYTRAALRWQKLPLVVADELSVEAIGRVSDTDRLGWSSSLFKTIDHKGRVRPGVFYSDISRSMFLLGKTTIFQNGDAYCQGKRIGPSLRLIPFQNFEVTLFGSDRLDATPGPRYRAQLQVRYQFAGLLNRGLR